MPKESAKALIAKLALDEELSAKFDAAQSAEAKLAVLSEAGYTVVTPDDIIEVQSDLEQKALLGNPAGYLGCSFFPPSLLESARAASLGRYAAEAAGKLTGIL